jgi:hypothetical protein
MNEWQQFVWLCEQAAEFILFPPFLICSTIFGIIIAGACIKQYPFKMQLWRTSYWLVFTQLLFYPAVIGVAVLGGVNFSPPQQPNSVGSLYSEILFYASLGLAAFWIWRMKGLRLLAFSLIAPQQMLLLAAFLVADMAIAGRWL